MRSEDPLEAMGPNDLGEVDVVVVGGGVGGLLAALTAARARARVVLVEPHPLGGRARVDERHGFLLNRGPRALYVGGAADRLLRAAGVDTSRGLPPGLRDPAARWHGELHPLPGSAAGIATSPLLGFGQKLRAPRAMVPLLRGPRRVPDDASLADWLGSTRADGALRALVEGLVRVSTYVHAPDLLAARAALANAHQATTRGVRYLDGGFGRLVDELAALAGEAGVRHVDRPVTAVRAVGEGPAATVEVEVDGASLRAGAVVLATGTPEAAAAILGGRPPSWAPTIAAEAACLELGVRRLPERGFVLGLDEPLYLSLHSPPADLAPEGCGVVHVMRYLAPGERVDAAVVRAQLRSLAAEAGIDDGDVAEERYLARMTVTGGLPLAAAGGLAGRPPVAVAEHPGTFVVGDWVGAEGMLLDAVAASAVAAGQQAASRSATMVAP